MNKISVEFNQNKNIVTLKYLGKKIEKNINMVDINEWSKMSFVSFFFNEDHKWVFSWEIYNKWEQFLKISEYKKSDDLRIRSPWTDLVKWSYIDKPSKGTLQTNNVYRLFYKPEFFTNVEDIQISVIGSPYGDFNTKNYVEGYYY